MSDNDANDDLLPPDDEPESVGIATMDPDGTLRLQLRTVTADGIVGEMLQIVPPGDPRHEGYLAHLGGMVPGRAKPIPPFPPPEIDPDSV